MILAFHDHHYYVICMAFLDNGNLLCMGFGDNCNTYIAFGDNGYTSVAIADHGNTFAWLLAYMVMSSHGFW